MSGPLIAALLCTMALFIATTYFLMGSVPLLTLKHDTPMDARVVRGFFNIYYVAEMCIASGAAVSLACAGSPRFAAAAATLALLATLLRWKVMARMDALRARIEGDGSRAISAFRRVHVIAILINLAQLVFIVGSLITVSIQLSGPLAHP